MKLTPSTLKALTGTLTGEVTDVELKQGETKRMAFAFLHNGVALDLTNYTFSSEFRKILADSAGDTSAGYNISNPVLTGNAISLTANITVTNAAGGLVQFYLPPSMSAVEAELNPAVPVMYTGYFAINDGASVDPEIIKKTFLVIVNNDGV